VWSTRWYDCFDTLVTRVAVEPADVFRLLGWRLVHDGLFPAASADPFVAQRIEAEASLRAQPDRREVTLVAIYAALRGPLGWTRRQAARAARLEIDTESRLLIPIRGPFEEALAHRDRAPVVLSDTYFSGRVLSGLLRGMSDPSWCPPRVFASADVQRTKVTGELFTHVLSACGLEPAAIVHRGDHPASDDSVPRALGLRTDPVVPAGVLPYEYAGTRGDPDDAFARVVAGAMRAARVMAGPDADPGEVEAFGGLGAAALAGYVAWMLTQARRRGITRLWFLARDGQVLLAIARRMAPVLHPDAELRYVHASRLAWCLPAYPDLDEALERWLARYVRGTPVAEIGPVLGLDGDDIAAIARLAEATGPGGASADPALRRRYAARALQARGALLGHLRDEGLIVQAPTLLVDVGWNASLQLALTDLLRDAGIAMPPPVGAYVSLRRRPPGLAHDALLEYAPGETRINTAVVELQTRADHGSTLGYTLRHDGRVVPVLQALDSARAEPVRRAQRLTLDHVDALMRWMGSPGFPVAEFVEWLSGHGRQRLVALCRTPSNAVGRALSAQIHDDGPGHVRVATLARRYDRLALWRALVHETFGGRTSWWLEGSIAASTRGRGDFMVHLYAQRLMLRLARRMRRGADS
jgi:hypothetical protein